MDIQYKGVFNMKEQLASIKAQALSAFAQVASPGGLEELRVK